MSLSKGKVPEASGQPPWQRKCTRCRNHGCVVPQKGHMKSCPFLSCACSSCRLVTERSRSRAMQQSLRRAGQSGPPPRQRRPRARTGEPTAAVPLGGARVLPTGAPEPSQSPLDLRSRPGAAVQGPSYREARGNENVPYFSDVRPAAPVLHVPIRMSGHYPAISMPYLPAVLFNHGLYRPLMLPHFQLGAVQPPPADFKPVFFTARPTVPEAFKEELMPAQPPDPPLAKDADLDIVGLD